MSNNDLTLFQTKGQVPAHIQSAFTETNIEDRATIPSLSPSGKTWTIGYEGTKTKLERNVDGDMVPVAVMRVVLLDYAKRRGRAYYEGAYNPDQESAPVCWSEDGITPDPSSTNLQAAKCAQCPRAIKGSKTTDSGKLTVECAQHRMLAVMPVVGSSFFPHALRLKIAITSDFDKQSPGAETEGWRAFQQYTDFLKANGVTHTASLVTKMKFDPNESYPKLFFGADRWLTAEEIAQVKPFTTDPETAKLLGRNWTPAGADGVKTDVPAETPAAATTTPTPKDVEVVDDDEGEVVMVNVTPKATPEPAAKPEPVQKAEVAPQVTKDVPEDVKKLLGAWNQKEDA